MHKAMLWDSLAREKVRCRLCAHGCLIKEGGLGLCRVRENKGGELYTRVWGKPVAANPDPIEKKPLFHFQPGTRSFSIATIGCNFQCGFCQNWDISQFLRESGDSIPGGSSGGKVAPPEVIVNQALEYGCSSIAYTYTEPTIYFEYAFDIMKLAVQKGLKNVFVSNGYQSADCLEACRGLLHAANVDLKAFSDDFYKNQCKARLQPVLDTLVRLREQGVWLEVTTLLIPGMNDSDLELNQIAGFLAADLGSSVPWHVSAYNPRYKYVEKGPPATPLSSLERALEAGERAGLKYVYAGNVPGHDSESTYCPGCGQVLVKRRLFSIMENSLKDRACPHCGAEIKGVWS